MNLSGLDDWGKSIITTLIGGALGFVTSIILKYVEKKKPIEEREADAVKNITDAANDTVITTQKVIEILDSRLQKDREYYDELIDRSRKDCELKIETLKIEHSQQMEDIQSQMIKSENEKVIMGERIEQLELEKTALQKRVDELTIRLKKYENGAGKTGELKSE